MHSGDAASVEVSAWGQGVLYEHTWMYLYSDEVEQILERRV